MTLADIGELVYIATTVINDAGGPQSRANADTNITIYDNAGNVVVNAAAMANLAAGGGVGIYGYSWNTVGRNPGVYVAVCHCTAITNVCIPAVFLIELRQDDTDDVFANVDASETAIIVQVNANETKIDVVGADVVYGNNNTDTLISRIPGEVAQKAHLVNGAGDITPPVNIGIWDVLDDGTISLKDIYDNMVGGGAGAFACILTVDDSVNPVPNVDVWLTSDLAGTLVVAGPLSTDVLGQITFYLDIATYYVWCQKIGYTQPTPPSTWVVLGATNKTMSVTATGAVPAATYCSYTDVGNLMQVTFGAGGKPTASDVDALIVMAEDAVDNDLSCVDRMKSWKAHAEAGLYLDYDGTGRIDLGRADIGVITDSKLYYFNGTNFNDFLTEGDDDDFYTDRERGIIHFPDSFGPGIPAFWDTRRAQNVKLSFAWGAVVVPKYVKLATMLKTAMLIASNDDYADVFTTGDGRVQTVTKLQQYERLYKELIETHREVR